MVDEKLLSSPFSTGDGGGNFERHIQAAYALIMLAGGYAPGLPPWPIEKIKLQGRCEGFNTDDLIIFVKDKSNSRELRLLGQIKHSISITKGDSLFADVIAAMWKDYNDPNTFTKGSDRFALITGPVSKTDCEDVKMILEWARSETSATSFFNKVNKSHVSSEKKQEKLEAFRYHIDHANGSSVSDEELYAFLKSFYLLGYDFNIEHGVVRSLLFTIMEFYNPSDVEGLWTKVIDEVSYRNQNAGVLNRESFSLDIQESFKAKRIKSIPEELISKIEQEIKAEIEQNIFTSEIAPVFLLGAWDESFSEDTQIIEKITDTSYRKWITPVQTIASHKGSAIECKNRRWKFKNRVEYFKKIAPLLYDAHLDKFKEIAVTVFCERDPKFDLPKEERYAASIHGKNRIFSTSLAQGIAEGAALIGTYSSSLTSCSANKGEVTAALLVREILSSNDWVVWSGINDYLPLLAEASPTEFLDAIEEKLNDKNNTLFQLVFAQEGGGILGGWNYITGILWGLETLAWCPEYLSRVTIILGQLAEIDPGGNWANRPINSLTTIFLPWLPQTIADVETRLRAIKTLVKESPAIGWKLLHSLLPDVGQVSTGGHKPSFREFIPIEFRNAELRSQRQISVLEYTEQVEKYSLLAVENAKNDYAKLMELIEKIDRIPNPALSILMDHISSQQIISLPDAEKVNVWEKLSDIVNKHRAFSETDWAMPPALVDKISAITELLTPSSPLYKHRRLFGQHGLYSKNEDYEAQEREIADQRTIAIEEILTTLGPTKVLEFAQSVSMPYEVGHALGRIKEGNLDSFFLPEKLTNSDTVTMEVIRGYIWTRFRMLDWSWVDSIDKANWTDEQTAQFLICLPFIKETWSRANALLGGNEFLYWKGADARPYQLKEDLKEAVDKLLQYKRPRAAIQCLHWMLYEKMEISLDHTYQALLTNLSSDEPRYSLDQHNTAELIKWLQNNPKADKSVLSQIEWIYLKMLDHYFDQVPKTLELKLANEPEFFCEAIRTVFKSQKEGIPPEEVTEERKQLATHVFSLLFKWQIPPGTMPDGSFNEDHLKKWFAEVKRLCEESGHLRIALDQIGKVFAHYPKDPSGLWIHRSIAELLNEKDADVMRSAFNVENFNMRGTHGWTAGDAERKIASVWRTKAEDIEKEGFVRFAASLREFAASYERDAEREASRNPYED